MRLSHLFRKVTLASLALIVIVAGLVALSGTAYADGFIDEKLDPALVARLNQVDNATPLEVVIVFDDLSLASQVQGMTGDFLQMQSLPMAGAILTKGQIETIASWPGIYSITLNQDLQYFLAESVPLIGADVVWERYGQRGGNPNVTVAVVDSGIDGTHPDLLYGQKVIKNVKMTPLGEGVDLPNTDTSSGHGTHVASTIGGLGVMSDGYYKGVAPDVRLIGLGSGEGISILTAVQSYDWVLTHHAEYHIRVVSNSWGTSGGDLNLRNPITMATYEAYKQGIVSVFAAGNDGGYDILNPYSIAPWVLSVAAGDKSRNLAGFSSRGKDGDFFKHPDLTAPGVDIYAARCSCIGITALDPNPNPVNPAWTASYTMMSGTSMATPHVSGAAALLLSQNPQLSPDEVMELLVDNTTPMPGYDLWEVGSGYLNALAAFEASLNRPGNLGAFLAGDRQQSIAQVLGVDPETLTFETVTYSGYSAAGVTTMPANEYPITVGEGVAYVDANLTWTPAQEDAFDMEVVDGDGNVLVSSGNSVNESESVLFIPPAPGQYTLRVVPFAAVNAQYTLTVATAYGETAAGWPPHSEPQYDYIIGAPTLYKTYGALGLGSAYFRGGESGFITFSFTPVQGGSASADQLMAIYSDSQGNAFVDEVILRSDGDYQTSFDLDQSWPLAPGPIDLYLVFEGEGVVKTPAPLRFYFNHLETTLSTEFSDYYPGDAINFSGNVQQWWTVALSDLETAPVSAEVLVSLVDNEGNTLATTTVLSDLEGNYSGTLDSPASTRGPVQFIAHATYYDNTIVTGPAEWQGSAAVALTFPGNLAPEGRLYASPSTGPQTNYYIHISAGASDPDGVGDIVALNLTVSDASGKVLRKFKTQDFSPIEDEWMLVRSVRARGPAPWTVTLTATDSAGNTFTTSANVALAQ